MVNVSDCFFIILLLISKSKTLLFFVALVAFIHSNLQEIDRRHAANFQRPALRIHLLCICGTHSTNMPFFNAKQAEMDFR